MKTFMRCILIGVCVSLGYGLVEASDQVSVDTIRAKGCYKPGDPITSRIVDSAFSAMRRSDRSAILDKSTKYEIDTIEYNNFRLEFTGQGINNGKETCTDFKTPIGSATDNLKDQFIHCTITYNRIISFHDVELTDYDSEKAIPEDDLWGDKKAKDGYPKFELKSERKWHTVMRIKKALISNAEFTIEGEHCLVDGKTTLRVPDEFRNMKVQWTSTENNDILSDTTTPEITVTRQSNKILETTVTCTISDGCTDFKNTASIKLLPNKTPESKLTFSNCLPTDATYIDVVATNPLSGVGFSWGDIKPEIATSTPSSITVRYPVSSIHNFRINLTTTGGCEPHQKTEVVRRKLSNNNVKLQILDNDCLIAQHPFRVVTEPALIGWSLNWTQHPDYTIALMNSNRADMVTITKNKNESGSQQIVVKDKYCGGGISVMSYITALKMVVKDDGTGRVLQSVDTVDAGTKITFTAPKHSSITGVNPYTWSSTVWGLFGPGGVSMPLSKQWKGSAETTVTAPSAGSSISVTVSYVSCRGEESESYTIYSR